MWSWYVTRQENIWQTIQDTSSWFHDMYHVKKICHRKNCRLYHNIQLIVTLIRAKNGHVWHRKQMVSGQVPISGIDTDARWGFSGTKGWLFGYNLHMSCSTGKLAVPLTAYVTTVNVYDPHMYGILIEPLQDWQDMLRQTRFILLMICTIAARSHLRSPLSVQSKGTATQKEFVWKDTVSSNLKRDKR